MRPRLIHANATVDWPHWLAYDLTPLPGAERFAAGTPNVPGLIGLGQSLALLEELGVANIDAHTTALSRYAIGRLTALGLDVITPVDALGPIVTFRSPIDAAATDQLVQRLAAQGVVVVKHLDAAGAAYIRLSFHCYNVMAEIDRFIETFSESAH
jgi:cysteine desulfurase/selenocysteine lyase